jgi:hypothetical protein
MEAIAKRAGVSKKTFYARFPTKAELFTAGDRAHVHGSRVNLVIAELDVGYQDHGCRTPTDCKISRRGLHRGPRRMVDIQQPS